MSRLAFKALYAPRLVTGLGVHVHRGLVRSVRVADPVITKARRSQANHVERTLAAPLRAKFASRLTALLKTVKRQSVHAMGSHRKWSPRGMAGRIRTEFAPLYRTMVEDALHHARADLKPRGRARRRKKEGKPLHARTYEGYKYGNADVGEGFVLDVDAIVNDRLGLLEDAVVALDEEIAGRLEPLLERGATADELQTVLEREWQEVFESGWADDISTTEVGASLSNARMGAFAEVGVDTASWFSVGDDRVRETHQAYDEEPSHEIGFNYAEVVGESYTLRWPYDEACHELSEIINCRCTLVPDPPGTNAEEEE